LQQVIAGKPNPVILNGKQYLEFEDWQTLGRFYGVTAKVRQTTQVTYGDNIVGFEAVADAIANGQVISSAEAQCCTDEAKWRSRPIYEYEGGRRVKVGEEPVPSFQLRSMAQTRACAKVLRNVLAWVVVLAGYAPTPAEEMTGDEQRTSQTDSAVEVCPICGGPMWDNRTSKRSPKAPDFKCKNRDCDGAIWLHSKKEAKPTTATEDRKDADQVLRDKLFDQAEKLMAGLDVDKRKAALGRLAALTTSDMARKVNELAERQRARKTKDDAAAMIKKIRDGFSHDEIRGELLARYEGQELEDLNVQVLSDLYAQLTVGDI
jgi:hypothetical protein